MIRPSLEELLAQGDSRYTLVVMTARRARKIMSAQRDVIEAGPEKPVTRALREIAEGKVSYYRPVPGQTGIPQEYAGWIEQPSGREQLKPADDYLERAPLF
ncbi:MAG: DNA-directed RNA polymerase subunit omega [Firmicutes bacterium]|nr:DNA-directed RNA polymerase subunit omega [Bacillota bacterium]MDD4336577.1 DNA-directed RNA polymerase subunit omega [Bacillota bacterium]MDD4792429.1 DNA-directed RNA polymerase subunit omega [Bacillota bacterium]